MRELEDLLPTLRPRTGGLARLQRHVALRGNRRRGLRDAECWAWAVAACVVLAIGIVAARPWFAHWQQTRALTVALHDAMSTNRSGAGIRVANGAAIELPSGQPDVRVYLVQTAHVAVRAK